MCFAPQQRALFRHVLRATTACTFSTAQLPKVVRTWGVFTFSLAIVFRAKTACAVSTPQLLKVSEAEVLCTFWLRHVLRATTACTFSTSQLPIVVRTWCALCILTPKCASRHNGAQFFISLLSRWLRTHRIHRFSKSTFRPSGATNHWKNKAFRDFPTFSRTCIFFLLTLSLLWSSLFHSSLFYSSLLSDSSHLCFSSVHVVGS